MLCCFLEYCISQLFSYSCYHTNNENDKSRNNNNTDNKNNNDNKLLGTIKDESVAARKIQQWKLYQFTPILIDCFNKHLIESKKNELLMTVGDLISATASWTVASVGDVIHVPSISTKM